MPEDADAPYEMDPFYEAVGRVAASDALMDDMLGKLYADLLESPVAEVVAKGQGFDVVTAAIKAVLSVRTDHPRRQELMEALERARHLHGQRNLVVHAIWFGVAGMPDEMETLRARRWRTEPDMARWQLSDVRRLGQELNDHAWHIYDLTRGD